MGLHFSIISIDTIIGNYRAFGQDEGLKYLATIERCSKPVSYQKCLDIMQNIPFPEYIKEQDPTSEISTEVIGISFINAVDVVRWVKEDILLENIVENNRVAIFGTNEEKATIFKSLIEEKPNAVLWLLWLPKIDTTLPRFGKLMNYDKPFCLLSTDDGILPEYFLDLSI